MMLALEPKNMVAEKSIEKTALIYCRVSSSRQASEGFSLSAQEAKCRAYAETKGYSIGRVFQGVTSVGSPSVSPALSSLFSFIKGKSLSSDYVVIVDNTSRISRDLEHLLKIKTELMNMDVEIECVSSEQEEIPETELLTRLMCMMGHYEKASNRRRSMQIRKMRSGNAQQIKINEQYKRRK